MCTAILPPGDSPIAVNKYIKECPFALKPFSAEVNASCTVWRPSIQSASFTVSLCGNPVSGWVRTLSDYPVFAVLYTLCRDPVFGVLYTPCGQPVVGVLRTMYGDAVLWVLPVQPLLNSELANTGVIVNSNLLNYTLPHPLLTKISITLLSCIPQ